MEGERAARDYKKYIGLFYLNAAVANESLTKEDAPPEWLD